ncbi:MAG TPA: hypothetical protein VFS20_14265 [Longimicrobium sp.]|nr:hypothetical protein [Longimicrobium sp.]
MKRRRPRGFAVLAIIAAGFALFSISGILLGNRHPLVDTVLLLWSGLALVSAEALWNLRPWAHAASRALALAFVLTFAAGAGALASTGAWNNALMIGLITAVTALGLNRVVQNIRDRMWGIGAHRAAVRVPVPRQP